MIWLLLLGVILTNFAYGNSFSGQGVNLNTSIELLALDSSRVQEIAHVCSEVALGDEPLLCHTIRDVRVE